MIQRQRVGFSSTAVRWAHLVLGAAGIGGYAHAGTHITLLRDQFYDGRILFLAPLGLAATRMRQQGIPWGDTHTSAAQRNESGAEYARVEEKLRTLQKILEAKAYAILATVPRGIGGWHMSSSLQGRLEERERACSGESAQALRGLQVVATAAAELSSRVVLGSAFGAEGEVALGG